MKKVSMIIKRGLMIWGVISLVGIIAFYVSVAYQIGTRNARTVEAEDQDVRYIVDWFGLNPGQQVDIEHSYNPTGSWAGDYMKAFAIRMAHIDSEAVLHNDGVSRGDELTPILRNAVEFAIGFTGEDPLSWFPAREQILSSAFYVYPVRMNIVGMYPDSVQMMFIRPDDNRVFFIAVKT
ncbi:MAG: hypothetical protein WBO73_16855 [Gammaproteobacteria bacterium]|jgi:hypothetical protein